jgi:NodT family efflux transporter outer membrane factor (OMF) lipoprotein
MCQRNSSYLRLLRRVLACPAIMVPVIFSACAVGPNYVRPTMQFTSPSSFKEMGEWKKAQPRDHEIRGKWWEAFNDPDLNALADQVNISNQNLAVAEAQYRQATALVRAAKAAFYPSITIGASYSLSLFPSVSGASSAASRTSVLSGSPASILSAASSSSSSNTPTSQFSLPISISWEPDIWGRIRRTVEASSANAQASEADLQSARLLAQAELAQDYFQIQAIDRQKQLLDRTVADYRKFLDLTKNRYAAGVASMADVLQAESQLKTTQAQAIDLGVQRAQLEHAIALLAGKPASLFSVPVSGTGIKPPDIPVGVPSELLERRPDVAAAERRVAAANAQIGVAIAAYFPTITLNASLGFQAKNFLKWFTWPSRFFSVGPSISETVFQGGLRMAQTDEARAAYDASVASYRQTVLTALQEVEDNLAALRILENEARVQDEALKASRQSVNVTMNQYKAGTASYLNVITAQTAALSNELSAVSILNRRMAASVLLVKALGGGWNSSALNPKEGKAAKAKKKQP